MRPSSTFWVILLTLICSTTLHADIYVWIDENGVKHFTNSLPPEGAEIFIKDSEVSQVAAADKLQTDSDKPQSSSDIAAETSRLREELEALRKQLAEIRETSPGVSEEMGSGGSIPTEEPYDSSEEGYSGIDLYPSYEVNIYNSPYYGYGGFAYGYGGALYYYRPYYFRKGHFGYYKRYHSHRHHRGKHHNLKRHRHKNGHRVNHPKGNSVNGGPEGRHYNKAILGHQHIVTPRSGSFLNKYSAGSYPGRSPSGFRTHNNYHR